MARQARAKSESGIYHVMMRGTNKQQIFFDQQDYKKYIQILLDCKKVSDFELYAYCIMPNHIHLLIKEKEESLSMIMKRIGCRFVYWYNAKYQRVGHLFQDRFKSEPIGDDEYFLCALRYIHFNPVEAGLAKLCSDYEYSSYQWYFENGVLVDKKLVLSMMNIEQFVDFHRAPGEEKLMDLSVSKQALTDDDAQEIVKAVLNNTDFASMQKMEKEQRTKAIKTLKEQGLSIRQIVNFTGFSKYYVEKA